MESCFAYWCSSELCWNGYFNNYGNDPFVVRVNAKKDIIPVVWRDTLSGVTDYGMSTATGKAMPGVV